MTTTLTIEEVKDLLTWCSKNKIPQIKYANLEAVIIIEEDIANKQPIQPTNLDYIPSFSVDVVHSPLDIEEIKS